MTTKTNSISTNIDTAPATTKSKGRGKAKAPPAAKSQPPAQPAPTSKIGTLVALLQRSEGATLEAMMTATGWQGHSVRGAISGSIKKKLGLTVTTEMQDDVRVWRIAA
jgi:hypothetical protein